MAKPASTSRKKSLSQANLVVLGADRLAEMLMEAAALDPALKRQLRLELAAEVGAADLAFEIDKRLATLAGSKARVSWRKRPGLLNDLRALHRMIVERLADQDPRLGLDRLVAWFDLYPSLSARVSDAKGELPLLFDAATADLAGIANLAGVEAAAPALSDALATRQGQWAAWVGRAASGFDAGLAGRLLSDLTRDRPAPIGRMALVVRKLADAADDLDAWIGSFAPDDLAKPEIGALAAHRLALAGRPGPARQILEAAHPVAEPASRWRKAPPTERPPDAWLHAEAAVLDAEGRTAEAADARWALFERTLAPDLLRVLIAGLPDFEDVEALDRAFDLAARHPDPMKGLAFLIAWPALREAADLVIARRTEIRGGHDDIPLWAGRLAGRRPDAALALIRARALALARLGDGIDEEIEGLVAEAETLAAQAGAQDHAAFTAELQALAKAPSRTLRSRW